MIPGLYWGLASFW